MSTANGVAVDLLRLAAAVQAGANAVVVANGALLEVAIKREASQPRTALRPRTGGPEGPRLLTGSYNRSIGRRATRTATTATVAVGTNDDRGLWLEFGTEVALSYPHYGPGLDQVAPGFVAELNAVPTAAARTVR